MKPWFEKELAEADILKFPDPKAKVIRMPSVQSYPDFITGVTDLQAKQKDGTISQETYDKLYADLIHRFMKKESFDTPWYLRESILTEAQAGDRGEASEVFTACALHIGFKNKIVDKNMLYSFIMSLKPSSPNIEIQTKRNSNKDSFHLKFMVSKAILDWIFNKKNYEFETNNPKAHYAGMLDTASLIVMREYLPVIEEIYVNHREDDVNISIVGKGGGSIDVKGSVSYPGSPEGGEPIKDMQLSLKVGRTHFDQRSGLDFANSFGEALGIDTKSLAKAAGLTPETSTWKKYLKLRGQVAGKSNRNFRKSPKGEKVSQQIKALMVAPISKFYKGIATKLNGMMKSGNAGEKKERDIMANAAATITTGVFRKEGRVSLLNFSDDGYDVLDPNSIDKLSSAMATSDLIVQFEQKDRPYLNFIDSKDGRKWFHIRNAMDSQGTIRNFFEQGDKFKDFKRKVAHGSKPDQQKTQPPTQQSQTKPQQAQARGNDGDMYRHHGAQWINDRTGRIATRDVASHLDQNKHLQTPIPA